MLTNYRVNGLDIINSGHFLLTKLLMEKMAETAAATGVEGRIVNVSSTIHSWFAGDDAVGYIDAVTRRKMCVELVTNPCHITLKFNFSKENKTKKRRWRY